jgi:hypothetical protein
VTPRSGECRECARADAAEEQFAERDAPGVAVLDEPCPECGQKRTVDGERPCAGCRADDDVEEHSATTNSDATADTMFETTTN